MKIVSGNYRDRRSPLHWIIRDAAEGMECYKAFPAAEASGVRFRISTDGEEGFGCKVVADCQSAKGKKNVAVPKNALPMKFDGVDFVLAQARHRIIKSCRMMWLCADGSMFVLEPVT